MKNINWKKALYGTMLAIALFGFADATYLTIHYYQNTISLPCVLFTGCDTVTRSVYASIFGIPVAILGIFFYVTVFLSMLVYIDKRFSIIPRFLPIITFTGFAFSVWFMYAQIFLLQAICSYCLMSAISATLLFVLSNVLQKVERVKPIE